MIACVVAPLLHNQDAPADAVSITEPPLQNVTGPPAVIVAVGNGLTVTRLLLIRAEHVGCIGNCYSIDPAVVTLV